MAVRRPARVELPESAYAPPPLLPVPDCLAGLVESTWSCYSRETVAFCGSPGPGVVCASCAMVELGEDWVNFKARTNMGIPKAKFYRDLERAQGQPDPEFARSQAYARAHR